MSFLRQHIQRISAARYVRWGAAVCVGAGFTLLGTMPTRADIDNTAVATGMYLDATQVTSDPSTQSVPVEGGTPQLTLTKSIASITDVNDNGLTDALDTITYSFRVENTGNLTLNDVIVTDELVAVSGDAIATMLPNAVDATTFSATYIITQDDVDAGGVENTALALGQPLPTANGTARPAITDISDSGEGTEETETAKLDNSTDEDPTNDPTVSRITADYGFDLTKVVDLAALDTTSALTYTITATNTGTGTLTNPVLGDAVTQGDVVTIPEVTLVSGDEDDDQKLDVGEVWIYSATLDVTQPIFDAGADIVNEVKLAFDEATEKSATAETVLNQTTDLTAVVDLTVGATLNDGGDGYAHVSDIVTYTYTLTNTSNVTLSGADVSDLVGFSGTGTAPTPTLLSGAQILAPGEVATFTATYALTQEDVDAGMVSIQSRGTAAMPNSAIVSDLSDSANIDDEAGSKEDVTFVRYDAAPSLDVEKSTIDTMSVFPTIYDMTYEIKVANTGNVTQTNILVQDVLAENLGAATLYGAGRPSGRAPFVTVTGQSAGGVNASYDGITNTNLVAAGTSLAPSATLTITIVARIYTGPQNGSSGFNMPSGDNKVTVTSDQTTTPMEATSFHGLLDTDNDGAPDIFENRDNEPTGEPGSTQGAIETSDRDEDSRIDRRDYDPAGYFYCQDNGAILTGGRIAVYDNAGNLLNDSVGIRNNIHIVQDGSNGAYQWFSVGRTGDMVLRVTYPSGTLTSATRPAQAGTLTLANAQDVYTGQTGNWPAGRNVPVGSTEFGNTDVMANYAGGAAILYDKFWTRFNIQAGDPNVIGNNIPVMNCLPNAGVTASKSVDKTNVKIGDRVTYNLTFKVGDTGSQLVDGSIVDQLPVGISYVPNSATVNGVAVDPALSGGKLTWGAQNISLGGVVSINYTGVIGPNAPTGKLTNKTWIQSSAGKRLSNIATATVQRVPEAVFDCSDVIGKVYDDLNQNGYQNKGEPGMAGVRVVTANGTRITTDKHGRFHVPCAALPKKIGSNFIMKLDERSLPTGYRVTSENPRVIRLTAGKFAKLNFGVAISNLVKVGLTKDAFDRKTGKPSKQLLAGIKTLIEEMNKKPSALRLTYYQNGESNQVARSRTKAVEALIRKEWRRRGKYNLNIERKIVGK